MADIVMAYSSAHAPMMSADPKSAPPAQAERFFGALEKIRETARRERIQAAVMISGEHFSNFFLDNLPQVCIGIGETHLGPVEKWLGIERTIVPGSPGLANAILAGNIADGFQPALSHNLVVDHGFMTVFNELDRTMQLPMVPIIMNCTTPPLMTLQHAWNYGVSVGKAIRAYKGLERVALIGAGGLSHFVGEPRVGDIDEEFDRWFLAQLEKPDLGGMLDMDNDELMVAGNGTGEVRAWVAVAGAMQGAKATTLNYEAIYEWINGMGVIQYEPA